MLRICVHFLVEFLQTLELGREAAFGGCVDYEDDFVLEGREIEDFALLCHEASVRITWRYGDGGPRNVCLLSLGLKS